ncbi:MAG: HD domain-containing protein [Calditrichaceae bacterium]|jgi:poly(A) polymerase
MNTEALFEKIYRVADSCGFKVYVVGGYVRDKLLGRSGKDIDFVVVGDAMKFADRLKKELHLRRLVRYPRFGTFMTRFYNYDLEFVNARSESYDTGSRKPVTRQADLKSDLSRRDFTINALAMDINPSSDKTVIDIFNGRHDLKKGIIRTPLDPFKTFSDDPLRMMRAIRFASQFKFKVEKNTFNGIIENKDRLTIVSQERVTDEFNKIMLSEKPSVGLDMLNKTGLMKIFLPELYDTQGIEQINKYHHKDVFYHTLEVVDNIAESTDDLNLRLAALFHDIGKPGTKRFDEKNGWTFHGHEIVGKRMVQRIMKRMRYSSEAIHYVKKLTALHLRPMALVDSDVTDSAVRRLVFLAGDQIDDLMVLCRADITSKNPRRVKQYRKNYDHVLEKIAEVEERDRIRNFQPPVNGLEIMQMFDLKPGPKVGKIKKFVEEAILNGDVPNEHDACIDLINKNKQQLLS